MTRLTLILLFAAFFVSQSGCKNCSRRLGDCRLFSKRESTAPRLDAPARPDPFLIPPPEGGLPTPSLDAPPSAVAPPRAGNIGSGDLPPPMVPETRNKLPERSGKELILPDPLPGFEAPAKPMTSAKPSTTSVTVPGFTVVREGIATGRKPSLDGTDSLRSAGYRSIVYLHTANADVSAMKSVVEKRGMSFQAVAIDAETMKASASRILEIVGDSNLKPMYICDDDGARTGILWYAYYRAIEGMSDDAAQVKAAPLGLRDAGPEKAKLLAAAQELLSKK